MTTWADAPKIQGPPQTNDVTVLLGYVKKLADITARMAKDLEFILNGNVAFDNIRANGIEAKNIKAEAITAEKIAANSVSAEKIQAGAVTADKIRAGAVTANKIDVAELSAISADLGHIRAGLIETVDMIGSTITGGTLQTDTSGDRIVINKEGFVSYDGRNTKRVALGVNDVGAMAGFGFYGPNGEYEGQVYSVRNALHIIADDELFLHGFGSVLVQGDTTFDSDVTFNGNVKFYGNVDFTNARVIGLP